ncbi:MAG: PilZ domain-containing protein [SAR324 cluster bacterium]|nr:PilZ domain-containing protein [SAR324 cluster bacterium]
MLSLYGTFEDGKIVLSCPEKNQLTENAEVIITFFDDRIRANGEVAVSDGLIEKNEAYYRSIREFQRVKAYGNISIIDGDARYMFPLNDYSQGGLSFSSKHQFSAGQVISCGISDPSDPDIILMELEIEVRGVINTREAGDTGDSYKIGCMFLDPVDEDLWHGLLQYLG